MSRQGAPANRMKRKGTTGLYPVSRAELVDGFVLESIPYTSRDGEEVPGSLLWDARVGGLKSYDAEGSTFYPAAQVRFTRWNYPDEDGD